VAVEIRARGKLVARCYHFPLKLRGRVIKQGGLNNTVGSRKWMMSNGRVIKQGGLNNSLLDTNFIDFLRYFFGGFISYFIYISLSIPNFEKLWKNQRFPRFFPSIFVLVYRYYTTNIYLSRVGIILCG
jgi:hypothetical protein